MEMRSAKLLDEACNHYNDGYGDEVLYAAWIDAKPAASSAPAYCATGNGGVDAFMARLESRQEQRH